MQQQQCLKKHCSGSSEKSGKARNCGQPDSSRYQKLFDIPHEDEMVVAADLYLKLKKQKGERRRLKNFFSSKLNIKKRVFVQYILIFLL